MKNNLDELAKSLSGLVEALGISPMDRLHVGLNDMVRVAKDYPELFPSSDGKRQKGFSVLTHRLLARKRK